MKALCVFLVAIVLFTGCSNTNVDTTEVLKSDQTKTIESTSNNEPSKEVEELANAKADFFYEYEIMDSYETLLVEAINAGDFSLVESTLVKDSELYKSQKKLVTDLNKKGIKEELIKYKVVDIKEIDERNVSMYVEEKIKILYSNKNSSTKDFNWIYNIVRDKDTFGISKLENWK